MPHQCVRCNTLYSDGAQEILKGCSCGARLFFYIKKKDIDAGKELINNLTEEDKTVILDFEAIRVLQPGKYELDLVHLFKKDPLIIKLEEGKYIIDLGQAFKEGKEK